ncbi:MAG: prealbumin-like fold domain-containing protein [Christensenellales bacterium]
MKRTKRIWALMLTLLMTLCLLPGAAMAEGEEYYWHSKSTEENTKTYYQRSVHRICEGGYIPAIYNIVDGGGEQHNVYCCDYEVNILKTGDKIAYRRLTLENSGYYDEEAAKKIRAIVLNSYPVLSLNEMMQNMEKENYVLNESVSEEQMLSGTQRAIWQCSNKSEVENQKVYRYSHRITDGYSDVIKVPEDTYKESNEYYDENINENVQKVYDYLMSLNGKEASPGGIVLNGVQAAPLSAGTSGAVDVLLRFELKNDRHGGITLDEKDVLTLTANNQIFPCSEWKNEGNGTYSVMLQGVTAGENIDVTISGEQYLARDAYFYEPVSGRHAAQCFVGVAEGSTPVFARGSFRIDEKTERLAYLSVKKTSNRAGTYKFNVYKAENDTKELINTVEITTAEANTCVASEKILLPAGTYIVEEEDAIKAGYTLIVTVDGKEHTVNSEKVENPSVQVTLKENGEAEVTVNFANCYEEIPSSFGFKKTDEHDAGVKGAVFALFKDEDCKEPTAYKQTSDSNGDVKFPLIPVGIYYMKETAAPYGYYLNKEVFKIEVLVQETSGTDNVAIYRKDAQDQWVKVEGSLEVENSRKPENHYTPEEPVPAIVVMPKTGDGSVLLSAAGLLLAAAAVCGLKRRIRG